IQTLEHYRLTKTQICEVVKRVLTIPDTLYILGMPQTNRTTYAINPTNKLHNNLIPTTYQKAEFDR
ncbi:hypothetical protein, partial [Vibrio parahaemolyticus]|uniref:hypothetical protein n=1 Tax=Vibrio parahaemolyticus TaxID=670 RepID=UPI0022B51535